MRNKKLVTILAMGAMCVGLVGCGTKEDTSSAVVKTTPTEVAQVTPTEEATPTPEPTEGPDLAKLALSEYIGPTVSEGYILEKVDTGEGYFEKSIYDEQWREVGVEFINKGETAAYETKKYFLAASYMEAEETALGNYYRIVYYNNDNKLIYSAGEEDSVLYDEDGKLIQEAFVDVSTVYTYDDKGVLIESVTYAGELSFKDKYVYDSEGRLIKKNSESFVYGSTETTPYCNITYTYEDENTYLETTDYLTHGFSESIRYKTEYEEDEYGRVVGTKEKTIYLDSEGEETDSYTTEIEYEYDEVGHLIKESYPGYGTSKYYMKKDA